VKIRTKKKQLKPSVIMALSIVMLGFSSSLLAEPKIRAYNENYFEDEDLINQYAHEVDSLAYGEALFLVHSEQDLAALVRLQQESAKGEKFGVFPTLLQGSIAAKQGMHEFAQTVLSKVQTNNSSLRDLDRLYLFQAELAYEQKDFDLLKDTLEKIQEPDDLPDPDAMSFLEIEAWLARNDRLMADTILEEMGRSPWRAVSRTNIALWHFRNEEYAKGIPLLEKTLDEIDASIDLDATSYWSSKGRRGGRILSPAEHEFKNQEMAVLTEKILSLIGYGYVKIMNQDPLQFEERLAKAQNIIFQIPQNSRYSSHGLELLAQRLMLTYKVPMAESYVINDELELEKRQQLRQQLIVILQALTPAERPLLTRLRSYFTLLELAKDDGRQAHLDQLEIVGDIIDTEIKRRSQILNQPQAYYDRILSPFYTLEQLDNPDGFSFKDVDLDTLPIHKDLLVDWLSERETEAHLKTLRFFSEGVAFSKEWQDKKQLFAMPVPSITGKLADAKAQRQQVLARLQATQTQLSTALEQSKQSLSSDQEQKLLKTIEGIEQRLSEFELQAAAGPGNIEGVAYQKQLLKIKKGSVIWNQSQSTQQRIVKMQKALGQLERTLAKVDVMANRLANAPPRPAPDLKAINAIDSRITKLDQRVTQALASNKILFADSFKKHVQLEQRQLQAALVKLRLQQAVAVQPAGAKDE